MNRDPYILTDEHGDYVLSVPADDILTALEHGRITMLAAIANGVALPGHDQAIDPATMPTELWDEYASIGIGVTR